ncbi:MAG: proline--tRNA ligase [Candidatus Pacearchaeota archaeon]|jgi:prolyl-tRNA synthetase
MTKEEKNDLGITVKKEVDMPEWYSQVCLKSELADYSVVKGSMIIRPNGYAIWQAIQDYFNENIIKKTKVRNAYFPLFIPESFFKKEAKHAEGFKPEVAWIDASLTKDGERLAIRPTSETIMYDSYSKWIRSYRDLPLKINQWCNVVRWETQATKLFLRSREFLWQEGHCVYETEEECKEDTINYIKLYAKLCEELLAIPVIVGRKTEKEKFAGAKTTYAIEAFMPDGKALQCGTSHELGQGFAKSFDINFLGKDEKMHTPWQNSWGLSTRLIGALVMTHSDNNGLILPPSIAENKVVIIPIIKGDAVEKILKATKEIEKELKTFNPILDDRKEYTPGWKYNNWELKGIPIRIEIGPKDVQNKQVILVRRDNKEKMPVKLSNLKKQIEKVLEEMQENLFSKAKKELENNTILVNKMPEMIKAIESRKLVRVYFCGKESCEDEIKDKTGGASSRCIPLNEKETDHPCISCNSKKTFLTYFSKSY